MVGGYPISGLDGAPRGYLGTPPTRSGWWGVSHWRLVGGTPSQVWMVGGGTPLTRSGWWGGYPIPGLDGGGVPGVPPLSHKTEQHSTHLLRGGRCASCVHAGRLFFFKFSKQEKALFIVLLDNYTSHPGCYVKKIQSITKIFNPHRIKHKTKFVGSIWLYLDRSLD